MLKKLMAANPDISFWDTSQQQDIPNPPNPSSLSISSPLHAAIRTGNLAVLRELLEVGFNPNLYQRSAPTLCVTPLMAIAMQEDTAGIAALNVIVQHSKYALDFDQRTPIFGVHILHLAAARLSRVLLEHIAKHSSLEKTEKTALGLTLLHVATLPLDDAHLNFDAKEIMQSMHEVGTLDYDFEPAHPNIVGFPGPTRLLLRTTQSSPFTLSPSTF